MLNQGYGIMPNLILFDDKLTSGAKLLFVLISSLCAEKGYCYAKNKYLAEKMGVSTVTIGKQISELSAYLNIINPNNHLRQISLKENLVEPQRKLSGSHKENFAHNNTSSNNTSNKKAFVSNSKTEHNETNQNSEDSMHIEASGIIKVRRELKWSTPFVGAKRESQVAIDLLRKDSYKNIVSNMRKYQKHRQDEFMPSANSLDEFSHKYPTIKTALDKISEWS